MVEGNRIGTDITGSYAVSNSGTGVSISDAASHDTIGGSSAAAGNVISGNWNFGVWITGGSSAITVAGNKIGTDVSGSYSIANLYSGVQVDSQSLDNTVGGTTAAAANVISATIVGAWSLLMLVRRKMCSRTT